MQKNVIVVGYPKSGNTWITRLVAELVQCPVRGFWNTDHPEMASEGGDRASDFSCYKSHFQLSELGCAIDRRINYVIYVVRDPRDVAVSGAHYFQFYRYRWMGRLFNRFPLLGAVYNRSVGRLMPVDMGMRLDTMIRGVLDGAPDVQHWCRISWAQHYEPFLAEKVLFIRYEDMLDDPVHESNRILEYLNVVRAENEILTAIEEQSFTKRKQEFLSGGDTVKATFLRSGTGGQWKKELTALQQQRFSTAIGKKLAHFRYET